MAMMASASMGNPYQHYDNTEIEQDLIDPDDGMAYPLTLSIYVDNNDYSEYQ